MRGSLTEADVARHAEMLGNRVRKTFRARAGRYAAEGTTAFRLYDRDIPEVRAVVDWYDGDVVVAEYERDQTATVDDWLGRMGLAVTDALGLAPDRAHLKRRRTRPSAGDRYGATGAQSVKVVQEQGLRFEVELEGHVDTGLFGDHRLTRARVRRAALGRVVLNLYGYTGAFTVYAAAGGAMSSVTVDRSRQYLAWARRNLALNDLDLPEHRTVEDDAEHFLRAAARDGRSWDLVVLDPPSFSTAGVDAALDVQRDHRRLVIAALDVLRPGGTLWFSTNHQRFAPDLEGLGLREVTDETLPEDHRGRATHRCWESVRASRRG